MDQRGGYGIVYREVMRSKELTPEAKAIYAYLCSFAGTNDSCYPGAELMRSELQMGNDRFYKHMHLLTDAGIVRKEQNRNGNRWGNTVYRLNHSLDFQLSQNRSTENRSTCNKSINNNSYNNNSPNNNSNDYIYGQQVDRVCQLMNAGRERTASKGRLNKSRGDTFIRSLIDEGFSMKQIQEVALNVGSSPEVEWDDLERVMHEMKAKGGI